MTVTGNFTREETVEFNIIPNDSIPEDELKFTLVNSFEGIPTVLETYYDTAETIIKKLPSSIKGMLNSGIDTELTVSWTCDDYDSRQSASNVFALVWRGKIQKITEGVFIMYLPILLTSAVIASIITAIVNIVVSIIDGKKANRIEEKRMENQIVSFRFSHLYEIWCDMKKDDSELTHDDYEIEARNLLKKLENAIFENMDRVARMAPLLDEEYRCLLKEIETEIVSSYERFLEYCVVEDADSKTMGELERCYYDKLSKYLSKTEEVLLLQMTRLMK